MDLFDKHTLRLQLEKIVIGLEEEIKIKGVGTFDAKIDSGNGGYNVIHGVDVYQQGDVVTFKTLTKEGEVGVSKKIKKFVEINIGSGNIEERPVIGLDVEIAGQLYKNVPFSIANRTNNNQKVLICKNFVKNKLNALIDVGQKQISNKGVRVSYISEAADAAETQRQKELVKDIKNKVKKATETPKEKEQREEKEGNDKQAAGKEKPQDQGLGYKIYQTNGMVPAVLPKQKGQEPDKFDTKQEKKDTADEDNKVVKEKDKKKEEENKKNRGFIKRSLKKIFNVPDRNSFMDRLNRAWHETGRYGNAQLVTGIFGAGDDKDTAMGDKELIRQEMMKKGYAKSYFEKDTVNGSDLLIFRFIDAFGNYYDGQEVTEAEREDRERWMKAKAEYEAKAQQEQEQKEGQNNNNPQNQQGQQANGTQQTGRVTEAAVPGAPQQPINAQPQPTAATPTTPTPNQPTNTGNAANQNQNQTTQPKTTKPPENEDPEITRIRKMYEARQNFKCYFYLVGDNIMAKQGNYDRNVKNVNRKNRFPQIVNTFFRLYRTVSPNFQVNIGDVNIRDKFAAVMFNIYNKLREEEKFVGGFALCWGEETRRAVVWENLILRENANTETAKPNEALQALQQEYDKNREEWEKNDVLKYQPLNLQDNGTDLSKLSDVISAEMGNLKVEETPEPQQQTNVPEENAEETTAAPPSTQPTPQQTPQSATQTPPKEESKPEQPEQQTQEENKPIQAYLERIAKNTGDAAAVKKSAEAALALIKNIEAFLTKRNTVKLDDWKKVVSQTYTPSPELMKEVEGDEAQAEETKEEEIKEEGIDETVFFNLSKDKLLQKWRENPVLKVEDYHDKLNLDAIKQSALDQIKAIEKPAEETPKNAEPQPEQPIKESAEGNPAPAPTPVKQENSQPEQKPATQEQLPKQETKPQVNLEQKLQNLTDSVKKCTDRNALVDAIQIAAALSKLKENQPQEETNSEGKPEEKSGFDEKALYNLNAEELIKKWNTNEALKGVPYNKDFRIGDLKQLALKQYEALNAVKEEPQQKAAPETQQATVSEATEHPTPAPTPTPKAETQTTPQPQPEQKQEEKPAPEPNLDEQLQKLVASIKQCTKKEVIIDAIQILSALENLQNVQKQEPEKKVSDDGTFDEKALFNLSQEELLKKWQANPILKGKPFSSDLDLNAYKHAAEEKLKTIPAQQEQSQQQTETPQQTTQQSTEQSAPAESEEFVVNGNSKSLLQIAAELAESFQMIGEAIPSPDAEQMMMNFDDTPKQEEEKQSASDPVLKGIEECKDRKALVDAIQILAALLNQTQTPQEQKEEEKKEEEKENEKIPEPLKEYEKAWEKNDVLNCVPYNKVFENEKSLDCIADYIHYTYCIMYEWLTGNIKEYTTRHTMDEIRQYVPSELRENLKEAGRKIDKEYEENNRRLVYKNTIDGVTKIMSELKPFVLEIFPEMIKKYNAYLQAKKTKEKEEAKSTPQPQQNEAFLNSYFSHMGINFKKILD